MNTIKHRIEQVEKSIGIDQQPIIHEIVFFGGGPLPPDEKPGNITIKHAHYESMQAELEAQAK